MVSYTAFSHQEQSHKQHMLKSIRTYTRHIAYESYPGETAQIPSETDLLQSHHHHSGGRAYDEHRASHSGTVSEELPEQTVDTEIARCSNRIHIHAACHKRNIVNNA